MNYQEDKQKIDNSVSEIKELLYSKAIDSVFYKKLCLISAHKYAKLGCLKEASEQICQVDKEYLTTYLKQDAVIDSGFSDLVCELADFLINSGEVVEEYVTVVPNQRLS